MIYLKNTTDKQIIYIPKNILDKEEYKTVKKKTYEQGYSDGYAEGKEDGAEEQKAKLTSISITENGNYSNEDGYNEIDVNVIAECKMQHKNLIVSKDVHYIVPDVGFDGLERVDVDATEYGVTKRSEGYGEGFDVGFSSGFQEGFKEGNENPCNLVELKESPNWMDDKNDETKVVYNPLDYGADGFSVVEIDLYETWLAGLNDGMGIVRVKVKDGIKFGFSSFTEIPQIFDFSDVTDLSYQFYSCSNLNSAPNIDTSECTNMSYMFYNCKNLLEIPEYNTINVKNMNSMLYGCSKITSVPVFDTSKVTSIEYMFNGCSKLIAIPQINTSSVTSVYYAFASCNSLITIPALNAEKWTNAKNLFGYSNINSITDMGGFLNLKTSIDDNNSFARLPNLTYESCINILNGLYDFNGNGITPTSSQGKLKVHANFLSLVGDEISIGTNKGWTITA